MESMLEILNKCLKDSNLETISKAELRKKYLEKTGLTKLPKEDKELFSSAVNTAFLNIVSNETKTVVNVDNSKTEETSDNEIKKCAGDGEIPMNSSSDDDFTSAYINENVLADQFTNGVDDSKMESADDSDEIYLASYKNNAVKKSSNDFKNQRGKRTLISSSEDETIQIKSTKNSKILKKSRKSSDSEAEEMKKISKSTKSKNRFKKTRVESSDSEDEPLTVLQKKSNSLNSVNKSDLSGDESLLKYSTKQFSNAIDSEDEPLIPSTKKKVNSSKESKDNASDSEDEPLAKFQKSDDSINLNGKSKKFKIKHKSNSSDETMKSKKDPEDEPLTKYRKCNDSIHSGENSNSFIKKFNSSNKSFKLTENTSESDDEPVLTFTKKKSNLLNGSCIPKNYSSESDDECLATYSKKKVKNSIDSDEEQVSTFTEKSNSMSDLLKSVKNLSDSEDEPPNKLSNKKTENSRDSEKGPVKKIVKGVVKHSLKQSVTNGNKSKEQTLKKKIKRFVDSDDDHISKQKKGKSFDERKNSLLSDSSEDEPLDKLRNKTDKSSDSDDEPLDKLSNKTDKFSDYVKKPITNNSKSKEQTVSKKKKRFVDSDDDENTANEKEKPLDGQNDSFLSDSSEDENLSNITKEETKYSSDSESEPLNKLSIKKSDMKRKSSEGGSSSYVDENEEHSSKKIKLPKRKEANDSGKGKKRPSASENRIEHLKKYVRVAGIRIQNYNKLFENCKTIKAKCEKLMSLLEKEGLKGRPTLEKCKKLKKKIETKREIAELDLSNILKDGGGRPKRSVCSDTTNCKLVEEKSTPIKKFSRLQDIFDSEESD